MSETSATGEFVSPARQDDAAVIAREKRRLNSIRQRNLRIISGDRRANRCYVKKSKDLYLGKAFLVGRLRYRLERMAALGIGFHPDDRNIDDGIVE